MGTAATGGLKIKGAEESRRKGKEAPIWQQTLAKAQANAPAGPQAGSGPPEPSQGPQGPIQEPLATGPDSTIRLS